MSVEAGRRPAYSDDTPTHNSRGGGSNARRSRSEDRRELLSDQDVVDYNPDNIQGLEPENRNTNYTSSTRGKPSRTIFDDV